MARDALPVDISKDGLHSISPTADSFETTGPFTVTLRNHGRAVHVHCNLDDDLARVARLPETNHFVETDSEVSFPVDVQAGERPVSGRLKIVTGYGAEEHYVPVTITEPKPVGPPSERTSDEATPASETGNPGTSLRDALPVDESLPVLVLAGLALVLALGAAATLASLEVFLGLAVVVVGVAVALWILFV
ncbi:DUF7524 family protein [Haloarchaeobius amylolyticus]|uniref:DUF7524 family protein n=1 Tax=Haloarchaeobius amylolyticus TaxID=1198296 RepID=UPI00226F2E62|nr:hypothetical protein [Haloarchaeobius amylolyticus]